MYACTYLALSPFIRHKQKLHLSTRSLSGPCVHRGLVCFHHKDRNSLRLTSDGRSSRREPPFQIVKGTSSSNDSNDSKSVEEIVRSNEAPSEKGFKFKFKPKEFFQPILNFFYGMIQFLFGWLIHMPMWQKQQKLKRLKKESEQNPNDASDVQKPSFDIQIDFLGKHAAYLRALNESHPDEVLERVDSGQFSNNEEVVVEYIRALVLSKKLSEYAKEASPEDSQDHRSVKRLLKDLQVKRRLFMF